VGFFQDLSRFFKEGGLAFCEELRIGFLGFLGRPLCEKSSIGFDTVSEADALFDGDPLIAVASLDSELEGTGLIDTT
jgi:hypothetical protein